MEEKKKGKGLVVALVLFILISLGLGGYIAYDKVLNKEEVKTKKEEKKEKKEQETIIYSVDDEKISGLIDNILTGRKCNEIEEYTNDKKVETKDIDNEKAYLIAEARELFESQKESIPLDDVNNVIKKYLGKDYKFDPTSLDSNSKSCPQYKYDSSTKTFNKQQTACGWTCGPRTSYKITKAVDTNGVLKLDVKVIFVDENISHYYSDYAKSNIIGELDNDYNSLFVKGSNYQFTFKQEDGNYIFVSSYPMN